jgi:hypothetical protein
MAAPLLNKINFLIARIGKFKNCKIISKLKIENFIMSGIDPPRLRGATTPPPARYRFAGQARRGQKFFEPIYSTTKYLIN